MPCHHLSFHPTAFNAANERAVALFLNKKIKYLEIIDIIEACMENASHLAWIYDIYCRTGIQISFPIIADRNGEIARKYGMIASDISNTETVRNVFIIDDKGIIRTILIYPMNVGRFIPEILRIVKALQVADCSQSSTGANWIPNQPVILPPPKTFCELQNRQQEIIKNRNGINWYLSFKEIPTNCIDNGNTECIE